MSHVRLLNGLDVHYSRVGEGPDVVMIHGVVAHRGIWHLRIAPLLWDRYRVLTYDLRGHGYTTLTETGYTPTELATDLKELLDSLHIEKAYLVGHSFGADIALYFAYLYPERVIKAVLIEPMVPALVRILTHEDFGDGEFFVKILTKMGVPIPEERRFDGKYLLKAASQMPTKWGPLRNMPRHKKTSEGMLELVTSTSITRDMLDIGDLTLQQIPTIQTPIHLIFDSSSALYRKSYSYLRSHLPNVTQSVLNASSDELAHLSPLEEPEIIAHEILKAFAEASPISQAPS